jgi:hypothetical protein
MPDTHVLILGMDENVVVFAVLSAVLAVAVATLRSVKGGRDGAR